MDNYDKYRKIVKVLQNKIDSSEITYESACIINNLAYDRYVLENVNVLNSATPELKKTLTNLEKEAKENKFLSPRRFTLKEVSANVVISKVEGNKKKTVADFIKSTEGSKDAKYFILSAGKTEFSVEMIHGSNYASEEIVKGISDDNFINYCRNVRDLFRNCITIKYSDNK